MPSPRQIAEQKNNPAKFDRTAGDYDAVAGTPTGVAPQRPEPDYNVNPVNPPEGPAPAKNLK